MLKPIMIMYPVIAARDEEERASLRPIGRHRERYHDAIHGMTEIIQAADEMGFWGAATPEHHFWSEGYRSRPRPAPRRPVLARLCGRNPRYAFLTDSRIGD